MNVYPFWQPLWTSALEDSKIMKKVPALDGGGSFTVERNREMNGGNNPRAQRGTGEDK